MDLDAMERDAKKWHSNDVDDWLPAGTICCTEHVPALVAEVRRLRASPAYLFPPPTAAQRAEAAYVRGALGMDYATEDAERERWLELAGDAPAITETEYSRAGAAVLGAYADGAPIIVRRPAITETDYATE